VTTLAPNMIGLRGFCFAANLCHSHPICNALQNMSPFLIRYAAVSDASALAELAARTFTETFGADNSPEDLKAHLESSYGEAQQAAELADPEVRTLLAYGNDELIGFAQVRRKLSPACVVAEKPVELHRFYLVRSVQGAGVAKPLMLKACEAARELGGRHLWLGVWERNSRAISFYLKSGFAKVGSHNFIVGSDTQTDWVFIAPLSVENVSAA
jgi:diamine N-acetyltransferase